MLPIEFGIKRLRKKLDLGIDISTTWEEMINQVNVLDKRRKMDLFDIEII
jgi:hypothetical protein